jgi:hypothetical protein
VTQDTRAKAAMKRVVLLAADGITSRVVAQALAREGLLSHIIVARGVPKLRRFRMRARRRGVPAVASQLACGLAARALFRLRGGVERQQQLLAEIGLEDRWPNGCPLTVVSGANDDSCVQLLRQLNPDAVVVNGTPILKKPVFTAVSAPFVNTHCGLTPDYRGASGGFWAVWEGRPDRIGVTVHIIDEGVDTGPVIAQRLVSYDPSRDGLHTLALLQYQAALPLLVDYLKTGAAPGPLPGSETSKQWYSPGLYPYLKTIVSGGLRY